MLKVADAETVRISTFQRRESAAGLTARAESRRVETSATITEPHRAAQGQFFTPEPVARHLASLFDYPRHGSWRLLDPGAGVGSLTAAVIAESIERGFTGTIEVTVFELDERLIPALTATINDCVKTASPWGIEVVPTVQTGDFLEWVASYDQLNSDELPQFDASISNPPYKKIAKNSRARTLTEQVGCGSGNLYTAFITMTLRVLADKGQLVTITPRSFANGPYFLSFRRDLMRRTSLRHIHNYTSRSTAFADTDVLQENVLWRADAGASRGQVVLAHSEGPNEPVTARTVMHSEVVSDDDPQQFFHFRLDELDDGVASRMAAMPSTLTELGISVSTGMVVDFRSRDFLIAERDVNTIPIVYPAHLHESLSRWPNGSNKPSHYILSPESERNVLPEGWYVVVKRFSAKEEKRRVVAAVWNPQIQGGPVAFDNKTNVFHIRKSGLEREVALGLAAYLNTSFVDQAFRQFSGHTQVNATDLRELRYPNWAQLVRLGSEVPDGKPWGDSLDRLLLDVMDGGIVMARQNYAAEVQQAIEVLRDLGLPNPQLNERTALVLLTLLGMKPGANWSDARAPLLGITQMMAEFRDTWGKHYAPNTRETVRRQSVHQMVHAGVLVQNPDDPNRPVNSGKNVYQVTPEAFEALRFVDTPDWPAKAEAFRLEVGSLRERWAMDREQSRIPLTLPNGQTITLSPGGQNPVIHAVVTEFLPRYAQGGYVLYIGDADDKWVVNEADALGELGITVDTHGKMPDVVVFDRVNGWLVLVEAVTSHGPMDPKRVDELKELFRGCTVGLVFVTAFPDRAAFKKWVGDLAWETEVWLASDPSHMVHWNGSRYLGPYE